MDKVIINETAQKYINRIREKCDIIKPLVAIRCITYNHEPYIREALESFVSQETDFPFFAIIHDDASTDGTADIIREYAERYPDIIFPILEKENQWSKHDGSLQEIINSAVEASGAKYIALCEGDDYWIDPLKLQKQITFLEENPDYVLSCHRYYSIEPGKPKRLLAPNLFLDKYKNISGFEFDLDYNMLTDWVTKTLTIVYRRKELNSYLNDCYYYRDLHLNLSLLKKGKGYCHCFIGGVYRKQRGGIWSQTSQIAKLSTEIKIWEEINQKHKLEISKKALKKYNQLLTILSLRQCKIPSLKFIELIKSFIFLPFNILKLKLKITQNKEIKRMKYLNGIRK